MHVRMIWRFQNHTGFTTWRGDRPLVPDGAPGEVKGSRDCHSDRGKVLLAYARYQAIWTLVRNLAFLPIMLTVAAQRKVRPDLAQ